MRKRLYGRYLGGGRRERREGERSPGRKRERDDGEDDGRVTAKGMSDDARRAMFASWNDADDE
jgi:splicing factor U2AF subunit